MLHVIPIIAIFPATDFPVAGGSFCFLDWLP
jgi:hypothetical protein